MWWWRLIVFAESARRRHLFLLSLKNPYSNYFQIFTVCILATHYVIVVVETYCFCLVRPPQPPLVSALTQKPLLELFPNIYSMHTGPEEFAW